jgi:hypothetical protein
MALSVMASVAFEINDHMIPEKTEALRKVCKSQPRDGLI